MEYWVSKADDGLILISDYPQPDDGRQRSEYRWPVTELRRQIVWFPTARPYAPCPLPINP
jgi:hypothetical protein